VCDAISRILVSGVSGENPILMMMTFWMLALMTDAFDADIRYTSKADTKYYDAQCQSIKRDA
jgi:hypothetical protein